MGRDWTLPAGAYATGTWEPKLIEEDPKLIPLYTNDEVDGEATLQPADNPGFVTKDSGAREAFDSGSVRDTSEGKPRYDLAPPVAWERVAMLYARGAEKYGAHNWTKGQPVSRFLESAERHLQEYKKGALGDQSEDHAAAVIWNMLAAMHFEGTGWDDKFDWTPTEPPC